MNENIIPSPILLGYLKDKPIHAYTIGTPNTPWVTIVNYGATITQILVRDREGTPIDIALGYDKISDYVTQSQYFGSTIGRFANRIAKGTFSIDDKSYTVTRNIPPHHLHGGRYGFDSKIWDVIIYTAETITLAYLSKDMEEGYPGHLQMEVTFTIKENNLIISYAATTDQCTPINITNHTYFNLNGAYDHTILDHWLEVYASEITEVDAELIPTGASIPIANTPFDFTSPKKIGSVLNEFRIEGLDHNYILHPSDGALQPAAKLSNEISGIEMEVYTTEPGLQIYTGNGLLDVKGKNGYLYPQYGGICLETQHIPDSPNHPHFPTTLLYPDQCFTSRTEYRFGWTDRE